VSYLSVSKDKNVKTNKLAGVGEGGTRVRGHKHVANSNKHAAEHTGTDPSSPSPPQARPCAGAKTTEGGGWMGWVALDSASHHCLCL